MIEAKSVAAWENCINFDDNLARLCSVNENSALVVVLPQVVDPRTCLGGSLRW